MIACEQTRLRLIAADEPFRFGEPAEIEHLLDCDDCRSAWLSGRLLVETAADRRNPVPCSESDRLVELLESSLDRASRERRIRHLADCAACTAELGELLDDVALLHGATPARVPEALELQAIQGRLDQAVAFGSTGSAATTRGWIWGSWIAAAAGIALLAFGLGLVYLGPGPVAPDAGESSLRGREIAAPIPVEPRGVVADAGELLFRWSDPATADSDGVEAGPRAYRLLIVDLASGATVLDRRSEAEFYRLGADELGLLQAGTTYTWIVEPLGDTNSAPSVAVSFELAR